MKQDSYRWTVVMLTDAGNDGRSGYSISRFDDDGYRIANAYHCKKRCDALTLGENFTSKRTRFKRKAIIHQRWGAKKVSQVLGSDAQHIIDPSSPTGFREFSAL